MKITFLEAKKPLTKSYSLSEQNELLKSNYPMLSRFTTHSHEVSSLNEFYARIVEHAKLNHCLLKGNTNVPLVNEPRAGSTSSDATTLWACWDFDKAPYDSVEEALAEIRTANQSSPFDEVSYIVQYSASHGLPGTVGLNCHVFMILSAAVPAPYLKAWLMSLNLKCSSLTAGVALSASHATLSYPLDITTCQNDKLLYIAPPVLSAALVKHLGKARFNEANRFQLVIKKHQALPVDRIANIDLHTMRQLAHTHKNELRKADGYSAMRSLPKMEAGSYTIVNPGDAVQTGIRVGEHYTHMNLNGGDSWSYYHSNDDFEYLYCFKHEDEKFRMREILPHYYAGLETARKAFNAAPTETGDQILAFCDFKSASYWRGKWNEGTQELVLAQAHTSAMLNDYLLEHGKRELDFVPSWDIRFDPTSSTRVDVLGKTVNTYVPSEFMRLEYTKAGPAATAKLRTACPRTLEVMAHTLNTTVDSELFEYWLNWWAVVYQTRSKTITAWLIAGDEGTGKGTIVNHIITPTLGASNVKHRDGAVLEDGFNSWLEDSIVVFINEINIAASTMSRKIKETLKHWITEPTIPIREMRRTQYEAKSYLNLIMFTNNKESLQISEGDRRYNITEYQATKIVYDDEDVAAIRAENAAWVSYIMSRPMCRNTASVNIKTEARQALIETTRTSNEEVTVQLMKGSLNYFLGMMPDMELQAELHGLNTAYAGHYTSIITREVERLVAEPKVTVGKPTTVASKLTRDELLTMFEHSVGNMPTSAAKFTQFLKHRGITIEPMRVDGELLRGMHVKWSATPEQYDELQAWYDSTKKPVSSTKVVSITTKKARVV